MDENFGKFPIRNTKQTNEKFDEAIFRKNKYRLTLGDQ